MSIQKFIVATIFIVVTLYSVVTTNTLLISEEKNDNCSQNSLISHIVPWTAGCFYSALYEKTEQLTKKKLDAESGLLEEFVKRGGVAPDILRYRFLLHQKYQNYFRSSFQVLHGMHNDYTRSNHHRIDHQVEYLKFLQLSDLMPLAQLTLNDYCATYILQRRDDIVENISENLALAKIPLSLDSCRENRRKI